MEAVVHKLLEKCPDCGTNDLEALRALYEYGLQPSGDAVHVATVHNSGA